MSTLVYGALTLLGEFGGLAAGKVQRLPGLTNSAGYLDLEILVQVKTKDADRVARSNPRLDVYWYSSLDDGVTWETGGNTSAVIDLMGSERHLIELSVPQPKVLYSTSFSFCQRARRLYLPKHLGIVVANFTGQDVKPAAANGSVYYRGISTT